MKPTRILDWDIDEVARALKMDTGSVREYFTDGRRVAFLIERRIAREEGFKLAANEGAAWDLIDPVGQNWEVRNITRGGIYFCPSYMVGSGRCFDGPGFLNKLTGVAGYIVTDIELFPRVPYWILSKSIVESWWKANFLGTGTKISREKALQLIKLLPDVARTSPTNEPRISI
jgi:hypothetical protein